MKHTQYETISDNDDILTSLLAQGIISDEDVVKAKQEVEDEKYLKKHNHKIWPGADGYCYTNIDVDDGAGGTKLKRVKRSTEMGMRQFLIDFYKKQDSLTLYDTCMEWCDDRESYDDIRPQSMLKYRNTAKRFFKSDDDVCTKPIRDITAKELKKWIKKTIKTMKLSRHAYNDMKTVLIGTFEYALEEEYTTLGIHQILEDMPLTPGSFTESGKSEKLKAFSDLEVDSLEDYLLNSNDITNLGVLLVFFLGCRVGEVSAVEWSDVDLEHREVHIYKTEVFYREEGEKHGSTHIQDQPKTQAGDRDVIFPEEAIPVFEKIRKLNPNGKYLIEKNGHRVHSHEYNKALDKACIKLGISKSDADHAMHDIRRTYITEALDDGMTDGSVAANVGHSDPSYPRRKYYNVAKGSEHIRNQVDEVARKRRERRALQQLQQQ